MPIRRIKIRYLKAYDFRTSLISGVFGGINNNGLFNVNFFVDRIVIPNTQYINVDEKGISTDGQSLEEKDGDVIREVQTGTYFRYYHSKTNYWFFRG